MGWIGWSLVTIALLALALFGLWRWAMATHAIWLLDEVDSWSTGKAAVEVAGPVSLGQDKGQELYVWAPSAKPSEPLPVLVFIHGGGWSSGNAHDYGYVARNFAAEGFVTVNLGYRLRDAGKYPVMLEDAATGLHWVHDNIARYGGDPRQIYLMGHSAGAYNAVMVALDPKWLASQGLGDGLLKGVIGLAGPYDFLPLNGPGVERAFGDVQDLAKTQPVNFARKGAPPLLLLTGDADTTVKPRNSAALAAAMAKAGQPVAIREFPGMGHTGIVMALSTPFAGNGAVKAAILDFIHDQEANSSGDIQPAAR